MKFTIHNKRVHLLNGTRRRTLKSPMGNGYEMCGPVDMAMAMLFETYKSDEYARLFCCGYAEQLKRLAQGRKTPVRISSDEVRLWVAAERETAEKRKQVRSVAERVLTHVRPKSFRLNNSEFFCSSWILSKWDGAGFPFRNTDIGRQVLVYEITNMMIHELNGGRRADLMKQYGVTSNTLRRFFKAVGLGRKHGGLQPSGRKGSRKRGALQTLAG